MIHTTNESDDGIFSRDQTELHLLDEINCEGSGGSVLKKGPWTSAEDAILVEYVKKHGEGNWNAVQKHSGLFRCGKSCRLRWANHLRPNLKKGTFTQEEERLIVELHAKMGNKWARMAAHLPGRTDNEIKNYWNTRIKRRQRAGLPLYPPEVSLQAMHDSQHGQNIIQSGDKEPQDLLQENSYEIPDVIFDSLKSDQEMLPYVAELPAISPTGMLMKGLVSSQYYRFMPPTAHRQKRFRESPALFPSYTGVKNGLPTLDHFQDCARDRSVQMFGLSFPLEPGLTNKNKMASDLIQGSHSLLNGNFSASKPFSEAVKLELPSLQYPESDLGSWGATSSPPPLLESLDAFIQSPPCETFDTDYLSSRNSGLLDALLLEAKTLSTAKIHSSDKSCNSFTMTPGDLADSSTRNICDTELEDYGDPISPLGHSETSLFSEYTPISGSGSSLDEQLLTETLTGCKVKSEVDVVGDPWTLAADKGGMMQFDFTWPDALLVSDWFEQGSGYVTTDAVGTIIGEDLENEYKHMAVGTSASSQG